MPAPKPTTTARRARRAIELAGGLALRQDLADVLGLSPARVHEIAGWDTFPEPVALTPSGRPVWAVDEVREWNEQRRHQPGPRKEAA